MSTFDFDEQFPTLKPACKALGRMSVRLGRFLIMRPIRGVWRRRRPILAVLALLIVAHSVATLILGRRVRLEIEAIQAKGGPVSMAALAGPKIPDSQNGAVIYARAFELMSSPRAKEDMEIISKFLIREEREKDPSLWGQAEKAVSRHRNVIPLIEQAASRPKCRFPVNWDAGIRVEFPHSGKVRPLGLLLRADALLSARSGDTARALHSVELGFRLSESLKDEPVLVSQLVRISLVGTASRSLRDALQQRTPSAVEVRRLFGVLARIDMAGAFPNAVKGERAFGIAYFQDALKNGMIAYALTTDG